MTLLEVLITTAIILSLAALSMPALMKARTKGTLAKTAATIAALETALSMYESDLGDYPAADGTGCAQLITALRGPVAEPRWKGPYMRFREAELDTGGNLLDHWQTSFSYAYPQTAHPGTPFTIASAGPDKLFGTADDIGNW